MRVGVCVDDERVGCAARRYWVERGRERSGKDEGGENLQAGEGVQRAG